MNGKERSKRISFCIINGFEYQIEEVNTALRNGKLEANNELEWINYGYENIG